MQWIPGKVKSTERSLTSDVLYYLFIVVSSLFRIKHEDLPNLFPYTFHLTCARAITELGELTRSPGADRLSVLIKIMHDGTIEPDKLQDFPLELSNTAFGGSKALGRKLASASILCFARASS